MPEPGVGARDELQVKTDEQVSVRAELNQADIWANTHYPQMWGAKRICLGAKALELILAGDLTWQEFQKSELTDQQAEERLETVNKAHKAYQISPSSLNSMKNLWKSSRNDVVAIIDNAVRDLKPGSLTGKYDEEQSQVISDFLSSADNRLVLEKVLETWQPGVAFLNSPEALDKAKDYRHSLRNYASELLAAKGGWEPDVKAEWKQYSDFFGNGIKIAAEGVDLDPKVKSLFLSSIRFDVVTSLPGDKMM